MSSLLWVGAIDKNPEYQSKLLRQASSSHAGAAPSGRPFGAYSGVRDGVGPEIITITPTTWTVAAHPGWIDTADTTDRGVYEYTYSGGTGDMTAADQTNDRIDRLDMQFVQGDGESTTDSFQVVYTTGVAAANPLTPTAPANSFPLATINVKASGDPTFTWIAPTAGGKVRAQYTQQAMPAYTKNTWNPVYGWYPVNDGDNAVSFYQGQGVWKVPDGLGGLWRFTVRIEAFASDGASHSFFTRIVRNGTGVVTTRDAYPTSASKEPYRLGVLDVDVRLADGDTFGVECQPATVNFGQGTGNQASTIRFERVGP